MRVLVLSSTFPSAVEPTRGVFIRERVRRIAGRAEVVVVAPVPWFPLNRLIRGERALAPLREEQDGLTVHHPRFLSVPRYGKFLDGALYALSLIPFLRRLRRSFDFEVIDAHFAFPDGVAATILGRVFRRPVVITLRGSIVRLSGYRLHRPQLRWALSTADRVTAVADSLRQVAIRIGVAGDHVRVIPNGVDARLFTPRDRSEARRACGLPIHRTVLLTVAALYSWKGQHAVVEVLPELIRRHPDVLYVMVGGARPEEERYTADLQATVSRLGLAAHVRFAGSRLHHELPTWFNAADLFVLATRSEGCPNVLLESLACGVPVVASRVGGVPEVVRDGADGILYTYGDAAALQDALARGLENGWDRAALAARAGAFDWQETAEQHLEELTQALKGGRGDSPGARPW
jgi:glycosyltransferase involved in cell wall biosynthesis